MRERLLLSGSWRVQLDPRNAGEKLGWPETCTDRSAWWPVTVPIHSFDADAAPNPLRGYEGAVWFARRFSVPASWREQALLLTFQGSNYSTTVWVNGHPVGNHEGGFAGFSLQVPKDALRPLENVLVVRTDNKPLRSRVPGPVYGWWNHGGLFRDVYLETRPLLHVADVTVQTQVMGPDTAKLGIEVVISNEELVPRTARLVGQLFDAGGRVVGEVAGAPEAFQPGKQRRIAFSCIVSPAQLWSCDSPYLYTLRMQVACDSTTVDAHELTIGLREVKVSGTRILLNGEDLLLKGINRHEDYPTTGRAHDPYWLMKDLAFLKEMGVNFIRTSHYPNHPAFYDLADRMGFLVMDEIPLYWWGNDWFGGYRDPRAVDVAREQLREMTARDKHHPCVIIWSVSNETCGGDPEVDAVNKSLMDQARQHDPTRLVCHVSARFPEDQALGVGDVICVNEYFGLFRGVKADTIAELPLLQEPLADALDELRRRYPAKPIVISEWGCEGILGLQGGHYGSEDYQAAYVTTHANVLVNQPDVRGLVYWAYADYPGHRGYNTGTTPVGYYGILTRQRQAKQVAAVLRNVYAGWQGRNLETDLGLQQRGR